MIGEYLGANHHGDGEAQKETQSEQPQTKRAEATDQYIQKRPGETVCEDHADVTARARVAHGSEPAQLMIGKAAPGIGGGVGFDYFGTEGYCVAGLRDACSEFVVVGEMIDERFESADAVEGLAAHGEGGAEAIAHSALDHFGEQHAGLKIGGDAKGF